MIHRGHEASLALRGRPRVGVEPRSGVITKARASTYTTSAGRARESRIQRLLLRLVIDVVAAGDVRGRLRRSLLP
jgi:hypothetical protein